MPLGKALHERFFGPLGLDATWYQAAEKPRARTAHGYRFAGTSRTAPAIDLSDGTGIVPFTSVVTAARPARDRSRRRSEDARDVGPAAVPGRVLGPEMTAEMLRGVGLTAACKPRVPYGLGVQVVPDRRPADGRPQRDVARVPGRDALPAGRGDDDLRPDQPEPGRPRRDRPGSARGRRSRPSRRACRCQDASASRSGAGGRTSPRSALRRGTTDARSPDHRPRTG